MLKRKVVNELAFLATSNASDDQLAVHFRTLTSDQLRTCLARVPVAQAEADRMMISARDQAALDRLVRIITKVLNDRVCVAS